MFKRPIVLIVLLCFFSTMVISPRNSYAQGAQDLPVPGAMVNLSASYVPLLIKGLVIHPENPFAFDFLVDTGNTDFTDLKKDSTDSRLRTESERLIKYFMAAMTIPENDLWVNLSPYEKDRTLSPALAQTEMGQDMLAQDYILKQITASLIYPEKDLGKEFWNKVYSKAQQLYGSSEIPVNTFNKVWIVADKADVFEKNNAAYVVGAHLKVMLEEDYLASQKHNDVGVRSPGSIAKGGVTPPLRNNIGSKIIREIVLPELEKEINNGKNFAPLRQMFYSMILASWFKVALKDSIMTQLYGNQAKVKVGVNTNDPTQVNQIYERYLKAYKKGVFNYIKEDLDKNTQQMTPRKYFSGGLRVIPDPAMIHRITNSAELSDGAMLATGQLLRVDAAMSTTKLSVIDERKWEEAWTIWGKIKGLQGSRNETERNAARSLIQFSQGIIKKWDSIPADQRQILTSKLGPITDRIKKLAAENFNDAAMAVEPTPAQLNKRIEDFGLSVVHQTAVRMLTKELRGAYWHLKEIIKHNLEDKPQLFIDLQVLFESILSKVSADEEAIEGFRSLRVIMNGIEQSKRRPQDFTSAEILRLEDATKKAIKDAADALAKRIFEQTAKKEGIIMMVRVSEGFGRDEVAESLRSNEVIVPDEIRGENVHINEAIREGKLLYYSSQQDKWYLIIDSVLDVIEGTNQFVTNTQNKPLGELTDNEAGATSFIVSGQGVRALGNLPDGYTGQIFTNLGSTSNVQKLLARPILEEGRQYLLNDPELYARNPKRIEDYLQFLAELRGQRIEELQEQIVVLDRKRESKIIEAVRNLQERIPGLTLNIIEDGTFTQGAKAILDQGEYEPKMNKKYGPHKTMITIGGSAEGFAVLALAGAAREQGAVGGIRVYSAKLNTGDGGEDVTDHSRRYNFSGEEEAEIKQLRPEDAEAILNGNKLFTVEDVQGEVSGNISFITNNGVFEQPGTERLENSTTAQVLSISNLGGSLKVSLTKEIVSDSAMSATAPLTLHELRKFVGLFLAQGPFAGGLTKSSHEKGAVIVTSPQEGTSEFVVIVKALGDYSYENWKKNGIILKETFIRRIQGGAQIFDWLIKKKYLEAISANESRIKDKIFTIKEAVDAQYPNKEIAKAIMDILNSPQPIPVPIPEFSEHLFPFLENLKDWVSKRFPQYTLEAGATESGLSIRFSRIKSSNWLEEQSHLLEEIEGRMQAGEFNFEDMVDFISLSSIEKFDEIDASWRQVLGVGVQAKVGGYNFRFKQDGFYVFLNEAQEDNPRLMAVYQNINGTVSPATLTPAQLKEIFNVAIPRIDEDKKVKLQKEEADERAKAAAAKIEADRKKREAASEARLEERQREEERLAKEAGGDAAMTSPGRSEIFVNKRFLVVDVDPTIRADTRMVLVSLGVKPGDIDEADSETQTFTALRASRYDGMILDTTKLNGSINFDGQIDPIGFVSRIQGEFPRIAMVVDGLVSRVEYSGIQALGVPVVEKPYDLKYLSRALITQLQENQRLKTADVNSVLQTFIKPFGDHRLTVVQRPGGVFVTIEKTNPNKKDDLLNLVRSSPNSIANLFSSRPSIFVFNQADPNIVQFVVSDAAMTSLQNQFWSLMSEFKDFYSKQRYPISLDEDGGGNITIRFYITDADIRKEFDSRSRPFSQWLKKVERSASEYTIEIGKKEKKNAVFSQMLKLLREFAEAPTAAGNPAMINSPDAAMTANPADTIKVLSGEPTEAQHEPIMLRTKPKPFEDGNNIHWWLAVYETKDGFVLSTHLDPVGGSGLGFAPVRPKNILLGKDQLFAIEIFQGVESYLNQDEIAFEIFGGQRKEEEMTSQIMKAVTNASIRLGAPLNEQQIQSLGRISSQTSKSVALHSMAKTEYQGNHRALSFYSYNQWDTGSLYFYFGRDDGSLIDLFAEELEKRLNAKSVSSLEGIEEQINILVGEFKASGFMTDAAMAAKSNKRQLKKVLIVDDRDFDLRSTESNLRKAYPGAAITTAINPEDAEVLIAGNNYDAYVFDFHLRGGPQNNEDKDTAIRLLEKGKKKMKGKPVVIHTQSILREEIQARADQVFSGVKVVPKGMDFKAFLEPLREKFDAAMGSKTPGGIDFNRQNLQMNISKEGNGVEIKFDPAMIEQMKKEGFDGFVPVILNITPIQSVLPILGLTSNRKEQLAKG